MKEGSSKRYLENLVEKHKFDAVKQVEVLSIHLNNIYPDTTTETFVSAVGNFITETKLPPEDVVDMLCCLADVKDEVAEQTFGYFIEGVRDALDEEDRLAEEAKKKAEEEAKAKAEAKPRRGRPRRDQTELTHSPKVPEPVKMPAGTGHEITITIDKGWVAEVRPYLSMDKGVDGANMGGTLMRWRHRLADTPPTDICIELHNFKTGPTLDVYIMQNGRTVASHPESRTFDKPFVLTWENNLYKITPE